MSTIAAEKLSGLTTGTHPNEIRLASGNALNIPGAVLQGSNIVTNSTLAVVTATSPGSAYEIGAPTLTALRANTRIRIEVRLVWWHENSYNSVCNIGRSINGSAYSYGQFTSIPSQLGIQAESVAGDRSSNDWTCDIDYVIAEQDVTNNIGDTLQYTARVYAQTSGNPTYVNRALNMNTGYHSFAYGCAVQIFEIGK